MSRLLFFVILFATATAYAGEYQRARDGKTLVWNNRPLPGDAASWSGGRDDDGYATGYGTLVWYTRTRPVVTGSTIPRDTYTETTRYSGTMVHGKFEGPVVNVDPTGRTFHGTFVQGKKTKDWAPGRGETNEAKIRAAAAKPQATPAEGPLVETTPAPPEQSEAPAESPPLPPPASAIVETNAASAEPASSPPPAATAAPDSSLRSLIAPPSSLRTNAQSEPSHEEPMPTTTSALSTPQLSATDVIHLAETEAELHGYDVREFRRTTPQYNAAEDIWSVSFEQRSTDATTKKHFRISVEDKTQKALITGEQ